MSENQRLLPCERIGMNQDRMKTGQNWKKVKGTRVFPLFWPVSKVWVLCFGVCQSFVGLDLLICPLLQSLSM
jgi:hypothetical protein